MRIDDMHKEEEQPVFFNIYSNGDQIDKGQYCMFIRYFSHQLLLMTLSFVWCAIWIKYGKMLIVDWLQDCSKKISIKCYDKCKNSILMSLGSTR